MVPPLLHASADNAPVVDPLRVLLVSYAFPPTGGAGVGRVLKLAKYLPDYGCQPTVLTVANPSVPVIDESLQRDVHPDLEIVRARTLEPGYRVKQSVWATRAVNQPRFASRALGRATTLAGQLLIPDPQILWHPAASLALLRTLRSGFDVVWITGPPFSQFLLAPLARLHRDAAVILDYRDEWTTYRSQYEMMGAVPGLVGGALERGLVRVAHGVTTATEAFRAELLRRFRFLPSSAVRTITNGYDPSDFPSPRPAPSGGRFTLTYAGTVFKLTSPLGLLRAIRRLHEREPLLARRLRVRFIGRIVDSQRHLFADTARLGVECIDYMPKADAAAALAESHMVLCLLDDAPGAERIYPGKVFELMYLGRPCLTIAPEGALQQLVSRHQLGPTLVPSDIDGIAGTLERALRAHGDGRYDATTQPTGIERFHRSALACDFSEFFRTVVDAHCRLHRAGGGRT